MKTTRFIIGILLLLQTIIAYSQQKSLNNAREIAINWFNHFAPSNKSNDTIQTTVEYTYHDTATFYIFNYSNGGYVLTSADNRVKPVLAYDFITWIDTSNISEETQGWLDLYGFQVCYITYNDVRSSQASAEWDNIENNDFSYLSTNDVPSLLEEYQSSRWAWWFNYFSAFPCDYPPDWPQSMGTDKGNQGCVPIAMSQIMKFHKFPIHGSGSRSYTASRSYHSTFDNSSKTATCSLSVDYSTRTYNYNSMPFRLTGCANQTPGCMDASWVLNPPPSQQEIDEVGKLQYDCGVSVNMGWFGFGTPTDGILWGNAFQNYFNYLPNWNYIIPTNGTPTGSQVSFNDFKEKIRTDLDNERPVFFHLGTHATVIDGYQAEDYFHICQGRGGADDCWNTFFASDGVPTLDNVGMPANLTFWSLAISGTNFFAGTDGGVFLSTNNGASWTIKNTGLTNYNIRTLAISGTNIFAGTDGGVFLSTNNGTNWTAVNTGLTNNYVRSLAISGTNIFAGTDGGGVFLSTNNGTSWTAVNTGLTNNNIRSLAISGTNIFAGTDGGGVFLSTNNGTSWTAVNSGLTNTYVRSLVISGTNIFAGTAAGVFLTTNNGSSWTAVNNGLTNTFIESLFISGTNVFAGTAGSGVFKSTNNGSSWSAVNNGFPASSTVFSFSSYTVYVPYTITYIFAGTNGEGLFSTTNNGTIWNKLNTSWNTFFAITHIEPNPCELNSNYVQEYNINDGDNITWNVSNSKRGVYRIYIHDGGQLTINSEVSFIDGGKVIVEDGGILTINEGKLYNTCGTSWAGIEVEGGGTLITNDGSQILLSSTGKILVDADGVFYYNSGTEIDLLDDATCIDIAGELSIGDNAEFTFTGNGYLRLSSSATTSDLITAGNNASITITGTDQTDKVLEIDQETFYVPQNLVDFDLTNGLVYMKSSTARLSFPGQTNINIDNVKFTPTGTSRTNQRGLRLYGQTNCTINNCWFEYGTYGIYGYLSLGATLSLTNCTFYNNSYGLYVYGESVQATDCSFSNNTYGFYGEYTSNDDNLLDNCSFQNNSNPIYYVNCDGNLFVDGSIINYASQSGIYATGNHYLSLRCTHISNVTGLFKAGIYISNGVFLNMTSSTSPATTFNSVSGPYAVKMSLAGSLNLNSGNNFICPNTVGTYKHLYGTITTGACPDNNMQATQNQWYGNLDLLSASHYSVWKNTCSANTIISYPTAEYTECEGGGGEEFLIQEGGLSSNTISDANFLAGNAALNNATETGDWLTPFNSYAEVLNGKTPDNNTINEAIWENSWESMRHCLKEMYTLKQRASTSNSEFVRTIAANNKMTQLQVDNYYRKFQLELEKATLYRMAGDYETAISLLTPLTEDTSATNREQAEAWLCIVNLEKQIAEGTISKYEIEQARLECPMLNEEDDFKSSRFNNSENKEGNASKENSSWLKVLPNPTSNESVLFVNALNEESCIVEITDLFGRLIKTINVNSGYTEIPVSFNDFAEGIYVVSLKKNGQTIAVNRVVISK